MDFIEVSGKTVDEALTEALIQLGTTSDKIEYEVVDKGSSGFLGIGNKEAVIRVRKKESIDNSAKEFLSSVLECMDVHADIDISEGDENDLNIELKGDAMGILIGKRGQTLDSLQYLISLVVNRGQADYIHVKVDTENYRERRKATLENLAKNISYKVRKSRQSVALEPMNPYERRIIHSALQNDRYVTTHSEGEEPFRRVVVTLKK